MPLEMSIKLRHLNFNSVNIVLHNQSRIRNHHINWTNCMFPSFRFNNQLHPFLHQVFHITHILSIEDDIAMVTVWLNFQDVCFMYKFQGLKESKV